MNPPSIPNFPKFLTFLPHFSAYHTSHSPLDSSWFSLHTADGLLFQWPPQICRPPPLPIDQFPPSPMPSILHFSFFFSFVFFYSSSFSILSNTTHHHHLLSSLSSLLLWIPSSSYFPTPSPPGGTPYYPTYTFSLFFSFSSISCISLFTNTCLSFSLALLIYLCGNFHQKNYPANSENTPFEAEDAYFGIAAMICLFK